MSRKMIRFNRDAYVKALKAAAFEIIENAEKMIDNVDHVFDISITIKISPDSAVTTEVRKQHVLMIATDTFLDINRD